MALLFPDAAGKKKRPLRFRAGSGRTAITSWRQWIALAAVGGLVADVAVDRPIHLRRPIIWEAGRDVGGAFRHRVVLRRTFRQQVTRAGGIIRRLFDRGDVAGVRVLVALLERRARIAGSK